MMDIKEDSLLWFINFLIKSPLHLQINLYQGVVLLIIIIIIIIINNINNNNNNNNSNKIKQNLQLSEKLHKTNY